VIPPKPSPHGCDGGSDFGSQLRYGLCAPSVLLHVLSSSHIGGESGSGLLCINSLLVELAWPSADVGPHMPEGRRRSGRRRASCSVMNWTASATLPRQYLLHRSPRQHPCTGKMPPNSSATPDLRLAMMQAWVGGQFRTARVTVLWQIVDALRVHRNCAPINDERPAGSNCWIPARRDRHHLGVVLDHRVGGRHRERQGAAAKTEAKQPGPSKPRWPPSRFRT
jgi:hypothetical protein